MITTSPRHLAFCINGLQPTQTKTGFESGPVEYNGNPVEESRVDGITGTTGDGSYNAVALDALSQARVLKFPSALLNGSAPFTVDAWVRFNGLPSSSTVMAQDGVFQFGSVGSSVVFDLSGTVIQSPASGPQLVDQSWHHVCATYDGGTVRLYMDGAFLCGQSASGHGRSSTSPARIGTNLEGFIRIVRVFDKAFTAEQVLANMLAQPGFAPQIPKASFDFSMVPPADKGPSALVVALDNNAQIVRISPSLSLGREGFARPFGDRSINPGGGQVDTYSVQAWLYADAAGPARQAVFVNNDISYDTGMALLLVWDAGTASYRVASQRGSDGTDGTVLTSKGTVRPGVWTNVATTFDGLALSIYINGVLDCSMQCRPIPLYAVTSDLLIGAAIAEGIPAPSTVLEGYIREIDVWSISLSAAQVTANMISSPAPDAVGLSAAYTFTTSPARNRANGHPIGLAEGAVLTEQIQPATIGETTTLRSGAPSPVEEQLIADSRANLNFASIFDDEVDAFHDAMQADMATMRNEASREIVRAGWQDAVAAARHDPTSLPFSVTTHEHRESILLICHTPSVSYIGLRIPADMFDECTLWRIRLIFQLVGGAIAAFTGVGSRAADAATAYIARIVTAPAVMSKLAVGEQMTASGAFAILSLLYKEGYLRPLVQLMVDIGFWALIRVLARMALVAAGVGAASVLASLAASVINIVRIYHERPVACDPLPQVVLEAIAFDHDTLGLHVDALSIRDGFLVDLPVPEWTPLTILPGDCPIAYAIDQVAGRVVTIAASFIIDLPTQQPVFVRATGGGIMGSIPETPVVFQGLQARVILNLAAHQLAAAGVRIAAATWAWEYRIGAGPYQPMTSTNHQVYVVLSAPQGPWVETPFRNDQRLPWRRVLDKACTWAAGATSAAQAAGMITSTVNLNLGLLYDTRAGKSYYTGAGGAEFLCTEFLAFVDHGVGLGRIVNCTDCATIVTTFVNSLGGNLFASVMKDDANLGFKCNQIIAIGTNSWAYPFAPNNGFSYHEVAWTGSGSYQDPLYDACLLVDGGTNPWGPGPRGAALAPIALPFTARGINPILPIATPFTDRTYRERLAQNGNTGIGACIPKGTWPWSSGGRRPAR